MHGSLEDHLLVIRILWLNKVITYLLTPNFTWAQPNAYSYIEWFYLNRETDTNKWCQIARGKQWIQSLWNYKSRLSLIVRVNVVLNSTVVVDNNSPIQDYVHPDDQTQPTFIIIVIVIIVIVIVIIIIIIISLLI